MRSLPTSGRILSCVMAALHLVLALGAGGHRGPHLDGVIAELPADLHHHAYGFAAGSPDAPAAFDECVACHLSRLISRLPTPAGSLVATRPVVDPASGVTQASPQKVDLGDPDSRAPPRA